MERAKYNSVFYNSTVYDRTFDASEEGARSDVSRMTEISIVTGGCGLHKIMNVEYECAKGDVFIIGGGVPHGYFAKSAELKPSVITVEFDPTVLFSGEYADAEKSEYCFGVFGGNTLVSYSMLNHNAFVEITDICGKIEQEFCKKDTYWYDNVRAHITGLLIGFKRYMDMADTVTNERPKEWAIVSGVMRRVAERPGDGNITLESIAGEMFISKSHLSRMFRRVCGKPFTEYVRDMRLSLACRLLKTTSLKNEEIVSMCGLKDVPSFYKHFKDKTGMTPYEYRMSQQTYKGEAIMSIYSEISENLQSGKAKAVKELVQKAVDDGLPAAQILNEGLVAGMSVIGEKFKNNEVYVPEVLVAARAMNMGMQVLKPLLVEDGVQSTGKACIGTVQGDLHDIGKNLVKMMMEGKGLEVIDLGTDVAPEAFVKTAIEQNCQIICCSALLTTTMGAMKEVVKCAEEAGIRDKVRIMIGGAPVSENFCKEIGADKYTSDAANAADAAVELCKSV